GLGRRPGMRSPELVSEALWSRIGAEQDADITIRHGVSLPDGGVCATIRDLGRFGLMHLREGRAGDAQVVPRDWVLDTRHGDEECIAAYARAEDIEVHAGEVEQRPYSVL